ncbi:hypothetical protein SOCEGT47_071680 [Sorangium cellulosum]|jgi:hypothetical protein|uniref:Uncharacterized protein n=1 Tax=Sorangium cellulosum TaxID=56 RepID=A0A4P2QBA6_SORCE|nr:hypothetical protein [Sorangium cellulosum]AUX26598.1 hypothetical protein SOCEGT47_071680 [Sorangium cellulosum]
MRRVVLALGLLSLAGCPMPPTSSQRLTEAALEMNTATRFGRMDVALERVGSKAREDFLRGHADWGTRLRVVDVEFGGFEMVKRDEADVLLDVLWLRNDETTVRTTRITQRWRDERGHWELVSEARKDGEVGLLGEPRPAESAPGEAAGAASGAGATSGGRRPGMSLHTRVIREE